VKLVRLFGEVGVVAAGVEEAEDAGEEALEK
jgi:hypothetical protein